jgi:hypothetical protein
MSGEDGLALNELCTRLECGLGEGDGETTGELIAVCDGVTATETVGLLLGILLAVANTGILELSAVRLPPFGSNMALSRSAAYTSVI